MEQRRFSEEFRNRQKTKITLIISQILFLLGAVILVIGLIYMMMNLGKSDTILMYLIPLMITGIALIIIGMLLKGKKETTKNKNAHIHRHF